MQYTKRLRSHGIDAKDFKILQKILDEPKGSTDISEESSIPRPTVLFRLNKMSDRGLVIKGGVRPIINWSPSKTCLKILNGSEGALTENKTKGILNIEKRLKRLFEEAERKRIYYLQNYNHLRNSDEKLSDEYKKVSDFLIVNGKVIQEGVTSTSGGIYYRKMEISRRPENIKKMISWVIVDDEYMDNEDSFFVLGDRVFIINLEKEYLKEIESATLSGIIINHIKNLSRMGRKIDISRFIKSDI